MKKIRVLRLFGLVAILAFAFVFVGLNFVQGQVKIAKKPTKPPARDNYVWSAVILDESFSSIRGTGDLSYISEVDRYGWSFSDSDPNVNVRVELKRGSAHVDNRYYTAFYVEIFEKEQIDFDFPSHYAEFYPYTQYPRCIYPGNHPEDDPYSMFHFLQNELHPHPFYNWVHFMFLTRASANQDLADIEQWTNQVLQLFYFRTEGPAPQWPCVESELFEYSIIEGSAGDSNLADDYGYFERVQENNDNIDIWKATVGMGIDGTDYTMGSGDRDGYCADWYYICEEVQFNKKKTMIVDRAIRSSGGIFDMKFEILFIRTKI